MRWTGLRLSGHVKWGIMLGEKKRNTREAGRSALQSEIPTLPVYVTREQSLVEDKQRKESRHQLSSKRHVSSLDGIAARHSLGQGQGRAL